MTKITFEHPAPPGTRSKGKAEIDTARLMVGTDGQGYIRDTSNGRLVPLSAEQQAEVERCFGSAVWRLAVESVEALR